MNSDKRSFLEQLDALDKQLSEPIFAGRLPFAFLEFLLSITGNWFGSVCFASTTLPLLIAICFEKDISIWHPWYGLVLCMIGINLTLWVLVLSPKRSASSKRARMIFYGPVLGGIAPAIGVAVLYISPLSSMAKTMGYFQICSWSIGVIPTAILKPLVKRTRPASWILEAPNTANERIQRLQKAAQAKHIHTLPKLFTLDGKASFPSRDAAGVTSSMYALVFLYPSQESFGAVRILGIACILLSCFGRMYFLAHHLLDVLTGAVTAYMMIVGLDQLFCSGGCQMEWWVPLAGHLMLLLTVVSTRWMFNWSVFGAGSIRVEDGDKDDGKDEKKE